MQKLSAGYRASKVIGSSVVNDAHEFIGKIDDLLVSVDGKEPYAVLSIGGFLGMGTHLVVVPYDTLQFGEKEVLFPAHQGRAQNAARVQVRDAVISTGGAISASHSGSWTLPASRLSPSCPLRLWAFSLFWVRSGQEQVVQTFFALWPE